MGFIIYVIIGMIVVLRPSFISGVVEVFPNSEKIANIATMVLILAWPFVVIYGSIAYFYKK